MLKEEWKNLWKNKLLLLIVVSIAIIPALYNVLFLSSMWDPYGKTNNLPVAVINLDEPVEYEGNTLSIGNDLVKNLKENDSLKFSFFDPKDTKKAREGLEDGTYYMVITIPKAFSQNATTLMDADPQKMQLEYATNPGTNYIASKLADSAMTKIQSSVQKAVTETYAESVFNKLQGIGDKMQTAASGAKKLVDGQETVIDGVSKISDGAGKLYDGAKRLNSGAGDLAAGAQKVADGASDLAAGNASLADGASGLSAGVASIADGFKGITSAYEGPNGVVAGAKALADGASKLSDAIGNGGIALTDDQKIGIQKAASGSSSVSNAAAQLSSGIAQGASDNLQKVLKSTDTANRVSSAVLSDADVGKLILALKTYCGYSDEEAKAVVNKIVSGSLNGVAAYITPESLNKSLEAPVTDAVQKIAGQSAVSGAEAVINSMSNQLGDENGGMGLLKASASRLASGASSLSSGINRLYEGNVTLGSALSKLNSGAAAVSEGSSKASKGAGSLSEGVNSLADGAKTLENGTSSLTTASKALMTGSSSLVKGLPDLKEGTEKLQSGLQEGANQISDVKTNENTYEMMAEPVQLEETQITKVPNNGSGMAAYMLCAGLWVGCISFTLMYPLTEYSGKLKGSFSWWFSKASVLAVVAILQAVLVVIALRVYCGFEPVELGKTIVVSCAVSCVFMSILYFVNALMGKVGSYLMVIFMLLQMSASAGTYPVALSADYVAKIHKYIPFSYGVEAFRSTISGGKPITKDLIVLIAIAVVFTVLTISLFAYRTRKAKKNKTTIYDFLVAKGIG